MTDQKQCNDCDKLKDVSEFRIHSQTKRPMSRCIECSREARRKTVVWSWTMADDQVIVDHYPAGGMRGCVPFLPSRNPKSIQQRAFRLGVKYLPLVGKTRADIPPEPKPEHWGIPRDDRPDEDKRLDYALRQFKEAEPTQNLTWRIAA